MMTAAYYKGGNDKSDNNKDKVCLLLKIMLVGHILDHVLDQIILDLVTSALQILSIKSFIRANQAVPLVHQLIAKLHLKPYESLTKPLTYVLTHRSANAFLIR